jgi:hypothetical protein
MKNEIKSTDKTTTTTPAKKAPAKKKGGSALAAASLGRAATGQVRAHSAATNGLASTGTNVSYEGATAPGSGVGTGYSSGQSAVGETFSANSDYEQNRGGSPAKAAKKTKKDNDMDANTSRH